MNINGNKCLQYYSTHGFGLKGLSFAVLGVDLDKSDSTARSNWEEQTLSDKQVRDSSLQILFNLVLNCR